MYRHIFFDIDGTLLDTEYAVLSSLRDTLKQMSGKDYNIPELYFALGITGESALERLGIKNLVQANVLWNKNMDKYREQIRVFGGVSELLDGLGKIYKLGIVTSKTREEFDNDFSHFGLNKYFEIIVCANDTLKHKPNPDPLLKYAELSESSKSALLYVGDSEYDMQCAKAGGIDFDFAKWGNKESKHRCKYCLYAPSDLLKVLAISNSQ